MHTYKAYLYVAFVLYGLCWLTNQPTKTIWGIGVSLPWLSLFAAIPITILGHVEEKDNWKIWCYIYALATLLYTIVVSPMSGSIVRQLPHLGACACFITYLILKHKAKNKFPI